MGKAMRMHELEAAFACCLGQKDFAMYKVMMFLTGNAAEKFRVSEEVILKRCNISESGYKRARKKLVEMGWITHQPSQYIQVNFDKIYSDYDDYKQGCFEKSSARAGTTASLTKPDGVVSWYQGDSSKKTSRFSENTYNNINNKIENNKIENKIGSDNVSCEDTPSTAAAKAATAPGASSQSLREDFYDRESAKKATHDFEIWFNMTERKIMKTYNGAQNSEDFQRMMESDEYKQFLAEAEKRQRDFQEEYGYEMFK